MLNRRGAHVLTDGQFGSTGKGLLAAYMAQRHGPEVDVVVTNAGPNSGHTFYHGDKKVVLKQLPTFAVACQMKYGTSPPVFISPGAIVDPEILNREVMEHGVRVMMHKNAAMIHPSHKEAEMTGSVAAVAGTRQGVGAALVDKINRDAFATVENCVGWAPGIEIVDQFPMYRYASAFVEVSQGFSLGLNSTFYPKVTSRECTVMQALADARIPAQQLITSMMVIRTYPIRVGNVDGFDSGGWYKDQEETTWERLGVAAETTTVTGRVRRVATFSVQQYREALRANMPRLILANFMNYLPTLAGRQAFSAELKKVAQEEMGFIPKFLYGYGPKNGDVSEEVR